ncbi:uncharacterized protein [Triticum aestivum]|uniref:uncharacterized protein isoform X1 n=1 Tax=Triticum aestivum TaxID=4565 RepID=UPI001D02326C|nr:uncharacterized protein LOC123066602 isoform X1 [Triticum aestivum]
MAEEIRFPIVILNASGINRFVRYAHIAPAPPLRTSVTGRKRDRGWAGGAGGLARPTPRARGRCLASLRPRPLRRRCCSVVGWSCYRCRRGGDRRSRRRPLVTPRTRRLYWRVCRAVVVLRLREERRVECCTREVEDAVVAKRREACPLITAVDGNMANRIGGILLFSCGHFSAESKSADNVLERIEREERMENRYMNEQLFY